MSAPVFPCFAYGRKNDGKRRSNSDEKIMKVWNMQGDFQYTKKRQWACGFCRKPYFMIKSS